MVQASDVRVAIGEDVVYIFKLQLVHRDETIATAGRNEVVPRDARRAPDPLVSGVVVGLHNRWRVGGRARGKEKRGRKGRRGGREGGATMG